MQFLSLLFPVWISVFAEDYYFIDRYDYISESFIRCRNLMCEKCLLFSVYPSSILTSRTFLQAS